MTSLNNTAYIKKLVKIVYEKEKEIQAMKRVLREKNSNTDEQNLQAEIHPAIKRELQSTSGQLRQVSLQMISMQKKIKELSDGLQDQITKSSKLTEDNTALAQQNAQIKELMAALMEQNQRLIENNKTLTNENAKIAEQNAQYLQNNRESILQTQRIGKQLQEHQMKNKELKQQLESALADQIALKEITDALSEKGKVLKQSQSKQKMVIIRYETELTQCKLEQAKMVRDYKAKQSELLAKVSEADKLKSKLQAVQQQVERLTAANEKTKQHFIKLTNQYSQIKVVLQNLQDNYNIKESQYNLLNQTLKDYEEFAFEIAQYIQAAYLKHCSHGILRSSKKLIRQAESCTSKFESALCKLSQMQLWMDNTAEKLEKIIHEYQLPNQTLQNLSIIAHSFEEKLELCDLTERIQKQKEEMDKNEELLLDNLQKEIQKSKLIEKSKLVELDEVREVLKVTKEVNRELMDQINGKQYVLSECRRLFGQVIGNKSSPEFKHLRKLLNLKI